MNIFERKLSQVPKTEIKDEEIQINEPKQDIEEAVAENKNFRIKFNGHKYKVSATSKEEAFGKLKEFFGAKVTEILREDKTEDLIITVKDIFNAIAEEITRIVTKAHPESLTNSYDRWVAVITEELGEIVHEINDAFEGKKPTKNTYVECVQLASATILLAKKFADEHPEMFEGE